MPSEAGVELCVLCRRQRVDSRWRPFCSERCRLEDLAKWVDGAYRVPGEAVAVPGDHPTDDDEAEGLGHRWPRR